MTWYSKRLTLFWLVLVAISVLSFESSLFGSRYAAGIVIVIGLVKASIVGREFMEIRAAPLVLRLLFLAWTLILGGALLGVIYGLRP
ncbi:MAG: cytochrome C oxidase subunit IV family protein [Pseudomonadota bacterium]